MPSLMGQPLTTGGVLFWLLLYASWWRMYEKAGVHGWHALVPFYDWYVQFRLTGRPGWHALLLMVPFVNLVVYVLHCYELARCFGRGPFTAFSLVFTFGYPAVAFGRAEYVGPDGDRGPSPFADPR